jgi:hypothetical protein
MAVSPAAARALGDRVLVAGPSNHFYTSGALFLLPVPILPLVLVLLFILAIHD